MQQSINESKYVDGVSLTCGTSPNGTHNWTYTTAIYFGPVIDRCKVCNDDKPFYVGTNFTVSLTMLVDGHVILYTDGHQCAGNETF